MAYDDVSHRYLQSYSQPPHYTGILSGCDIDVGEYQTPEYRWHIKVEVALTIMGGRLGWKELFDSDWTPACRMLASADGDSVGTVVGPGLVLRRAQQLPDTRTDLQIGSWEVAPEIPDFEGVQPNPPPSFSTLLGPYFSRPGRYRVELLVRDQDSDRRAEFAREVVVRDLVFAVLGDSFASGEGNPDYHGTIDPFSISNLRCEIADFNELTYTPLAEGVESLVIGALDPILSIGDSGRYGVKMQSPPSWLDLSAHRSMQSGAMQSLRLLEQYLRAEMGWTATLMSFAVSGAQTVHIDREPQSFFHLRRFSDAEVEPLEVLWSGGENIKDLFERCNACAQVHELAEAVGSRKVHGLLLSAGGNDLGFSKLVTKAVLEILDDDVENDVVENALETLPGRYEEINDTLEGLLNVEMVYLLGYPEDLFSRPDGSTGQGCGILDATIGKLSRREALLFRKWGERLREVQQMAAEDLGWVYVDVRDAFVGHGYCNGRASFFRSGERSCRIQGDIRGALHPNYRGHSVYRDQLFMLLKEQIDKMDEPSIESPAYQIP